MNEFIIVTNNSLVNEKYKDTYEVIYEELSFADNLKRIRDYIYKGHKLLTHPLSGSVKPGETPYKSVLLSKKPGRLDLDSMKLIEQAITSCEKFHFQPERFGKSVFNDFRMIDCTLLDSAMPSATSW